MSAGAFLRGTLLALTVVLVAACSGGGPGTGDDGGSPGNGGTGGGEVTRPGSSWDTMIWDQGSWE